jgi:hypothetical protein
MGVEDETRGGGPVGGQIDHGNEVPFLVKRVAFTPEAKGFLMFLGVFLIRIPLQNRPGPISTVHLE